MGKKDKKKKKGLGAQKTESKMEKKLLLKQKKMLEKIGEDDIEKIVKKFDSKPEKIVTEILASAAPSPRVNFSMCQHPEKEEIFIFGGEFFNGKKTDIYGDFFNYNNNKNEWKLIKSSLCPAPRAASQMLAVPIDGGKLFLFGGEFASPSQLQFYHFKDLWVYHIKSKNWEKINAPNPPSPRSGHRMVYSKKKIFVFGGFYDNNTTFTYFNDTYTFSLESYTWNKLEVTGTPPEPRSGCVMSTTKDGKIFVYGGYTKARGKKKNEIEHGKTHTDSFFLVQDEKSGVWKWNLLKPCGAKPHPRSGLAFSTSANDRVYVFGGVMDVEELEEDVRGMFSNEIHYFDLNQTVWRKIELAGSKKPVESIADEPTAAEQQETVVSDDVFQLKVGPAPSQAKNYLKTGPLDVGSPSPRMNSGILVVKNILYVFAGIYEQGHRQYTLNDFHSLDLHKLDSWKTLVPNMPSLMWLGSDSEASSSEDDDGMESEEDSEDSEESGSGMETE